MAQSKADLIDVQPTATTVPTWVAVPNFEDSDGDIVSAYGHLNALGAALNYLLGMYMAPRLPFTAYIWQGGWFQNGWVKNGGTGYYSIWLGQIRHQKDDFDYGIEVTPPSTHDVQVRITVGGLSDDFTKTAGGAKATTTGSIDVSSLTVGAFYEVRVEARRLSGGSPVSGTGSVSVRPVYLREVDVQSYSTPATFATGTTPTPTNWQLLSDQAAVLYSQLTGPRTPMIGRHGDVHSSGTLRVWGGTMTHVSRYLYYDLRMRPGYHDGTFTMRLYYDGNLLLTENLDEDDRFHMPGSDEPDGMKGFWRFSGTVDLNSLGLTVGDDYEVYVEGEHSCGSGEMYTDIRVLLIHEQQASTPTLTGWTKTPLWERGDVVTGTASAKVLRDDLVWLTDRVVYENYAVHRQMDVTLQSWMVRYHRWLHVRWEPKDEDEEKPALYYFYNGWQEADLDVKPNEWTAVDLDSIAGLWPGSRYRVSRADFYLEDDSA